MILRLLAALALLTAAASAQTKTVNKTISTNGLTENLTVPSGKTLTIASGATITAAEGSTITGFTASAAWGGITGTLSSQTDLQTALDAKANASALSSYLTTSTAASTYQPLDGDLTAIAALTTTSYGRELLTRADAAAVRSALSLGTLATQTATITDYLTIASAASTYQPLATPLTTFAALANSAGVLTNNGSGTLSYTATSTGGDTFGLDAGKIAVYNSNGELKAASALRLTAGPSVMGIWFNDGGSVPGRLTSSTSGFGSRTWTLPNVSGTLITTGDTGTVTNDMLAGSIALSKLATSGTASSSTYLRGDGAWTSITSGATLGANTFTALQQFTGTDHAGLQLNNLTTTQRDALTGSAGMVIWNTTAGRMQLHNGTSWSAGMVRLDGDTMTGVLTLPAGTVSAPALTFGDSTTGIYRSASNEIAITNSGTQRLRTTTSGVTITGTLTVGAGSIQDLGSGQLILGVGSHYAASGGFFATTLLRVSSSGLGGGNFTQLRVIAANTGLFENSTNPHALYVANTYTSSTSYEAAGIRWSSNAAIFGPVKGSGGGSSRNASYHTTETGVNWSSGSGSPESVVTAPVGSLYTRTDGGASTTLYIKESGTGNTGWIAK
jgi:hypothetical protein